MKASSKSHQEGPLLHTKTESNDNELTRHQKAHRKNIQRFMWGEENVGGHEYTVEIGENGKALVKALVICPGKSVPEIKQLNSQPMRIMLGS